MPLIGYLLGTQFKNYITAVDHWIAFAILAVIGANMIRESRQQFDAENRTYGFKNMTILSLATSVDALTIGVTFAFLQVRIVSAVSLIGVVTFVLSFIGVRLGNLFGAKFKSKAEIAGGNILIGMGVKILLEHLGLISF